MAAKLAPSPLEAMRSLRRWLPMGQLSADGAGFCGYAPESDAVPDLTCRMREGRQGGRPYRYLVLLKDGKVAWKIIPSLTSKGDVGALLLLHKDSGRFMTSRFHQERRVVGSLEALGELMQHVEEAGQERPKGQPFVIAECQLISSGSRSTYQERFARVCGEMRPRPDSRISYGWISEHEREVMVRAAAGNEPVLRILVSGGRLGDGYMPPVYRSLAEAEAEGRLDEFIAAKQRDSDARWRRLAKLFLGVSIRQALEAGEISEQEATAVRRHFGLKL